MAVSVSTATLLSLQLQLERSTGFASLKFSASTSLRFPLQLQRLQTGKPKIFSPGRQLLPRVEAKKQTFSSFDDLLANSDKPVLVDFYATWCGPCQYMVPVLNQVSSTLKDKIQVVKIDTEKYPSIANQYRIEALPTFIIFRDGKPCDRFEGALTPDQLIQRIETALQVKQ
ncbi:PREDICTED: thioredoxin Y1, chloroplastic-like [Nelumbo nucifera]|uniref:Thioredoxin Y1, chloroplastic-like n=1 Tax=Nelumbo nucifera TaxID=4432 RepID=A0A1U7YNY0_NELNU|nr:PREDICTED: thioredoxin Y1, chloroplastic-like [Nelumbo nucifera]